MRSHLIHLLALAYGAQMPALIYTVKRIWSDGRLRRILWYMIFSKDTGHWWWDATSRVVSQDWPFQPQRWTGVLSLLFADCARQGKVTLSEKSLRGVRACNSYGVANVVGFRSD